MVIPVIRKGVSSTSALLTPRRLNASESDVDAGTIELDASGSAISLDLSDSVGVWILVDPDHTVSETNTVTLTNAAGANFTGVKSDDTAFSVTDFAINQPGKKITITRTASEADYNVTVVAAGSPATPACVPVTGGVPGALFTHTAGATGNTNIVLGDAGLQGGTSTLERVLQEQYAGTKHYFKWGAQKNAAGGSEIPVKVEVIQHGSVLAVDEYMSPDAPVDKVLEFFPTADYSIVITDLSEGTQGSNRDAWLTNMELELTCQGKPVEIPDDDCLLIMRQDVTTADGLFTDAELLADVNTGSADPAAELKYRDLTLITDEFKDVNGAVTYKLRYEDTNTGGDVVAVFRQTSELTEPGATQVEIISNTVNTTQFVGLSVGVAGSASIDGFNAAGWWWSIGIKTLHSGSIPVNQSPLVTAKVASLYVVPLTAEQKAQKTAVEYIDKPTSVIYEVEADMGNAAGQPAGNGLFVIQNQKVNVPNNHVKFNAAQNAWAITAPDNYDLTVSTKDYETRGVTGNTTRVYHFRDITQAAGTVHGVAGEFGQGSSHAPASFVLPAGESITVDLRSVSSGNNQILLARAKVVATVAASKEQLHSRPLKYSSDTPSVCEINEFIHSGMPAFHLVFAHEGDGGTSMTATKTDANGVTTPVTYQNLSFATDAGNGQVNFAAGTNGNFNRRASSIETIQYPGDSFKITKPATPSFDGEYALLSPDPAALANAVTDGYRWFWNPTDWFLRGPDNANTVGDEIATGSPEDAVYEVDRTLAGFEFRRDGVLVHEVECKWTDYTDVTAAYAVDGVPVDAAPPWTGSESIANGDTAVIPTGVDLSTVEEVRVTFGRTNGTWGKIISAFDPSEIDLDVLQGKLLTHFDQTYLGISNMTAAQFAAGEIPFRAVTGSAVFGFEVSRIEFKKRGVVEDGRELIFDSQINTNTTGTLDNGLLWQGVVDRYEGIQASMLVGTRLIGSTYVALDDLVTPGSLTLGFDQAIHATLGNLDLASGDFGFNTTSNNTNADRLKIWGVLPHGRVSSMSSAGPHQVVDNQEHLTGRVLNGKPEYEAIYAYGLLNHTSSQSIAVSATTNFSGTIDAIYDLQVLTFDSSGNPYQRTNADDTELRDFVIDKATGSATHTYDGDWAGFSARWVARYTKA